MRPVELKTWDWQLQLQIDRPCHFTNKARQAETVDQGKQGDDIDCHRFCANEVRLRLSLIAYNRG